MSYDYTVKIAFSGGFVFLIDSQEEWPSKARVEVLIVPVTSKSHDERRHAQEAKEASHKIPEHFPQLHFRAKDLLNPPPTIQAHSAPDAHQHVCMPLDSHNGQCPEITIAPFGDTAREELRLIWAKDGRQSPRRTSEDEYLDWIPDLGMAKVTSIKVNQAVARITLPAGDLRAHAVIRGDVSGDWTPLTWRFEHEDPGSGRALAHQVVFRARLSSRLQVSGLPGKSPNIELRPEPDETLRLAFTNLPQTYSSRGPMHFSLYKAICQGPFSDLKPELEPHPSRPSASGQSRQR